MNTTQSLSLLPVISISLVSCIITDNQGKVAYPFVPSVSFGIYDRIPNSYVGDAYYYQDRYYYGGNYQRGLYSYQGRQYDDRYFHDGRYYYGGHHQHYGSQGRERSNHSVNQQQQQSHSPSRRKIHHDRRPHERN
jgi:hypothetical protein